jgi:hypothetical protein
MASVARFLEAESLPQPMSLLALPLASPGPTGANRRFMPRMSARFLARPRDGTPSLEGIDISFGGMMCASVEPTWPGNVLDLDLILPGDHKPVAVQGRIVELVSYRGAVAMRVRFEGISESSRKRIALWMARRTSA